MTDFTFAPIFITLLFSASVWCWFRLQSLPDVQKRVHIQANIHSCKGQHWLLSFPPCNPQWLPTCRIQFYTWCSSNPMSTGIRLMLKHWLMAKKESCCYAFELLVLHRSDSISLSFLITVSSLLVSINLLLEAVVSSFHPPANCWAGEDGSCYNNVTGYSQQGALTLWQGDRRIFSSPTIWH